LKLCVRQSELGKPLDEVTGELLVAPLLELVTRANRRQSGVLLKEMHAYLKELIGMRRRGLGHPIGPLVR
jgi:hypothetical protein